MPDVKPFVWTGDILSRVINVSRKTESVFHFISWLYTAHLCALNLLKHNHKNNRHVSPSFQLTCLLTSSSVCLQSKQVCVYGRCSQHGTALCSATSRQTRGLCAFNTIIPNLLLPKLTQLSVPTSICQWSAACEAGKIYIQQPVQSAQDLFRAVFSPHCSSPCTWMTAH